MALEMHFLWRTKEDTAKGNNKMTKTSNRYHNTVSWQNIIKDDTFQKPLSLSVELKIHVVQCYIQKMIYFFD